VRFCSSHNDGWPSARERPVRAALQSRASDPINTVQISKSLNLSSLVQNGKLLARTILIRNHNRRGIMRADS